MINLKTIKPSRQVKPPRLILYGPPKVGKSTWAANIPDALFLDIEGGSGNLNVMRVERDQLATYEDFLATLDAVLAQEHKFGALIIDSADFVERQLMFLAASKEHGTTEFGKIGYGKGPVTLGNMWRQVTAKLDEIREKRGMAIVLLAHEQIKKESLPNTDSYDKYTLALEKYSIEHLEAWVDAILFVKVGVDTVKRKEGLKERVTTTEGERVLHTIENPAWLAGNRYGLPAELEFSWSAFINAFNETTK